MASGGIEYVVRYVPLYLVSLSRRDIEKKRLLAAAVAVVLPFNRVHDETM